MNRSSGSAPSADRAPSALDQALDLYLAHLRVERGLLPATLESYARDLREYLDWLAQQGSLALAEVSETTVPAALPIALAAAARMPSLACLASGVASVGFCSADFSDIGFIPSSVRACTLLTRRSGR